MKFVLFRMIIGVILCAFAHVEALNDTSIDTGLLGAAWQIRTGGSHGPYYALIVNGIFFDGERLWDDRWQLIKRGVDFKDKRILELGCNIALTSVYALKYGDAHSAVGVDLPDEQLKKHGIPLLMKAAHLTHRAFGVSVTMLQVNLNVDKNYEARIGRQYDLVVCMSLLKWVNDKERLLTYLSQFPEVLYEGHDSDDIEIERFRRHGFTRYVRLGETHIGASYTSNQRRTLFLFSDNQGAR